MDPETPGCWGVGLPRLVGKMSTMIGPIHGIYAERGQSFEFVHPVLFYVFTEGFGLCISGAAFDKLKYLYPHNLFGVIMCTEMKSHICWILLDS